MGRLGITGDYDRVPQRIGPSSYDGRSCLCLLGNHGVFRLAPKGISAFFTAGPNHGNDAGSGRFGSFNLPCP